jgi:hypothetical protein
MKLKIKLLFVLVLAIFVFYGFQNSSKKEKWIPLFNGKDLTNWVAKIRGYPLGENYKNTFRVHDGAIQVNYENYDQFDDAFGHLFYKVPYSDYKIRMQYRFIGVQANGGQGWAERNSGVMLHCQDPATMGLNQSFPVSIEMQLLGGLNQGERPTGNVCTPGTNIYLKGEKEITHCINSTSPTYNGDQWVSVLIEVRHDSIVKHMINGQEVMTYTNLEIGGDVDYDNEKWKAKEGTPLKSGYISLQSESHPIEFKDIELLPLD